MTKCNCGPDPGAVRASDGWRCVACGRLVAVLAAVLLVLLEGYLLLTVLVGIAGSLLEAILW